MSDEDESLGDRLSDVAYDATEGVIDLVQGDGEGAVDHFLDMSRDAVDVITDGGFSTYIDRINEEHGIDLRESFKEGLEDVGEAAGEAVAEGVEWVSDTAGDAAEAVGDGIDWVGDQLSELNPFD